jgi:putative flippase GtrA
MILKLLKSQFVIYGIVGVGVTLLKLLSLYILRDLFDVVTYLSVTISYIIAVVTHFFINKHYTFKVDEKKIMNMMTVRYFVALAVAFVFYSGNIWILNQVVELPFYVAVFIALFLSFIFNYLFHFRILAMNFMKICLINF